MSRYEYFHLRKEKLFKIGYLGRIAKDKGLEIIPKIAMEINSKFSREIKFLICGPLDKNIGYEKKEVNLSKSKLQKELDSPFIDLRAKYYSKINFFKEIDVLILPTKREGFGIVCIEAQSYYTLALK